MNKETETQKLNTYLMMIVKWPGSEVCFFVCLLVFLEKVKLIPGPVVCWEDTNGTQIAK